MHPLLRANRNTVWGGLIVETLVHCGLKRAVISPGSRSTPLTLALALDERVEATPILDERSAAFFALGCAKASGEPVALVCTSGTAGANYLPAVIEAHYSGAPLIVLTADRPPELRDCAAGQTIDQVKLFGDYAHFYHELALPPMENQLGDRHDYLVRMISHAYAMSASLLPGPVHLNVPFRDPLAPVGGPLGDPFPAINKGRLPLSKPVADIFHVAPSDALPFADREDVLIVAGPPESHWTDADREAIAALSATHGWPLLADTASGLRGLGAECPNLVGTYDSLLRDPVHRHELRPGALVFFGQLPTSKNLRSYLRENSRLPAWRIGAATGNTNSNYSPETLIHLRPSQIECNAAKPGLPTPLVEKWNHAETDERKRIRKTLRDIDYLLEARWPDVLAGSLPARTPIFVASSMPIRDAEFFWPINKKGHTFTINRGANGIDGTLSTALGMAQAAGKPAAAVMGDLAFLHDQNGLLAAPEFSGSLTIFLINNAGGGIFENLPIAEFEPPFEKYFATPQSVNFAKLAAAHSIEHYAPSTWEEISAFSRKLPKTGLRIIELKTDRKSDTKHRQQILNGENR